ncbi:hypothetical protein SBOR_2408 [Sclerotinia borealis F-4128]|uniref:ATP-dependent RNA helicase n=1 Tax=Sclerotinia borealis (strain F-4128) TaxID=1432307 RepID=W9CRJ5_SCLBF|nr:hypothetical protein SBOR_2408 [Sclerotinia borealis F-4128]
MSSPPNPRARKQPRRGRYSSQLASTRGNARGGRIVQTTSPIQNAPFSTSASFAEEMSAVAAPPLSAPVPLNTPRFADLGAEKLLDPVLLKTITEDLKFDHMMPVQAATLRPLLSERVDCLAQAKTGTGKTIAFLIPAIQTLINKQRRPQDGVSLLVMTPTRELAQQIAKEASQLLQRIPGCKVGFAIGGTNKTSEEKNILNGCNILIATPGRLCDHLSDERVIHAFRNLDTLVFDEADRLLDMGFMNAIKDIIKCLPNKEKTNRQGMLFSATIAPHVEKVAHLVLSKDYKFISTIAKGEVNTHERVPQHLITVPSFSDVASAMVGSIREEMKLEGKASFKAIIFAPTAALVDFYAHVLSQLPDLPVITKLHSRVTQSKRTNVTNEYREATNGILVATDVVARGMDFPSVTNVFQVGIPADKESYIHRLGRTARAGKEGRGVFIVTQAETPFSKWTLKEIKFVATAADLSSAREVLNIASKSENPNKTYQAWLGYYKNHLKLLNWDCAELVRQGNVYARDAMGNLEPTLFKSIVGKMGLKGTPGLTILPDPPKLPGPGRGGAGRGGYGGGEGRSEGSGGRGGRGGGEASGGRGGATGGRGGARGGRGGFGRN